MTFWIVVLALCGIISACSKVESETGLFTAAVWNVQNLFDGQETGKEYAEFREAAGWTPEKYMARITAVSQAILKMDSDGKAEGPTPDIIGFVEVENSQVLEDLASGALSKHGYYWTAFSGLPGSALGIGVISRFPIMEARAHSITVGKETAPRPVLELRLLPRGKPLVFLLCHWKSKLGNDTEALRQASARVVQRRLRELKESEEKTPVIVMGDLNENHDEFFRQTGRARDLTALLPDDPDAAQVAARLAEQPASWYTAGDFLVLSAEKPPRSRFIENMDALYSPWGKELEGGSYYYRGEWETIDHFLLSDGFWSGTGWSYAGCRVLDDEPFTTSSGVPNSYAPRSGRGLSDHLPLLLYLKKP